MAKNRMSGCFASARKLRSHNPVVLCDFLELFPDFLLKERIILPADRDPDKIPYERLFDALMSTLAPNSLTVQLLLVDKLATEAGWQEVAFEAKQRGVPIPKDIEQLCDCARAMKIWTLAQPDHPDLLEASFARTRVYNKSSYTYYAMSKDVLDRFQWPDAEALKKLGAGLNDYFGVDEGTKVLQYDFDAEIWFLIRHQGFVKWQGVYENGKPKSRSATPELYDLVAYHKKYGHLRMNTHRKSDHFRYCDEFGRLLFDTADVFDPNHTILGLEPLLGDVVDLCKAGDIQGLHEIRMCEVCYFAMGRHGYQRMVWREKQQNGDLPLPLPNWGVPSEADSMLYATFRYKIKPGDEWQELTVKTGKDMSYGYDGDSSVLEDWLRKRRFICAKVA
jgi:hypothetical protein